MVVNTDCNLHEEEFDFDLCKCVKKEGCGRECKAPLIIDPVSKCDCLSITEFTEFYNHNLDENCQPLEDDTVPRSKIINNFNFYGPVYGDVSGFSTNHVSNLNNPDYLDQYAYFKKQFIWSKIIENNKLGQFFDGLQSLPFFL